ncbi:hypothetical protein RJZ56_000383 [Blastomyces dermatitidis]
MEEGVEEVAATMNEPGSRKDQRHLKKLCLERDGHRCMATGIIDIDAKISEADTEYGSPTDLCYVVPFSLGRWEKSKGEPNQYQILLLSRRRNVIQVHLPASQGGPDGPRLVTLERHGGATIELPSPALLQMRSTLTKIFHASGMAEYIEDLVRDEEEIGCLAPGSTTNLEDLVLSRMLRSRCE